MTLKHKLQLIIAKEGLILIGVAIILYAVLFFLQKVPVALPEYRLEFANGEIHTITINPEIHNDSDYKRLLSETYNPPPILIDKRIKEFIRAANIKSVLKGSRCINSNQIYISKLYSHLIGVPFILKVFIFYVILLFMRFIIWALRTLRERWAIAVMR